LNVWRGAACFITDFISLPSGSIKKLKQKLESIILPLSHPTEKPMLWKRGAAIKHHQSLEKLEG
jgi:hypothetical protein